MVDRNTYVNIKIIMKTLRIFWWQTPGFHRSNRTSWVPSNCQLPMKDFPPQRHMMSSHSSTNKVNGYIRDRFTTERNLFLCHHVQTISRFRIIASCQVGIRGSDSWNKAMQTVRVISTCSCHVLWYIKTVVVTSTNAQFCHLHILYIHRNTDCKNVLLLALPEF
jgi:hypothetical protein